MDISRKKGQRFLIFSLISSLIFLVLLLWRPSLIEDSFEALTLDYRFHIRNLISHPIQSNDVVVVAIDEKSLKEFGRWQWSRVLLADLIEGILELEPRVLAVDIWFPEPESEEADRALGTVLETAKDKIVLATAFDELVEKGEGEFQEIPDQIIDSAFLRMEEQKSMDPIIAKKATPTIPRILNGQHAGHVNSVNDRDGKLRWELLYLKYSVEVFPSLALQTARLSLGVPLDEMVISGNKGIQLGEEAFIHSDMKGRMLINYIGKEGTFKTISAAAVLNKKIDKETIKDRIVFLGTSAIATYDIKITPLSAVMPGVEKNATVVENILTSNFLKKSVGYIEIIAIIVTGLIMGLVLPRLSALKTALLSLIFLVGYIFIILIFFSYMDLWVNFIYPAANILTISVVLTGAKYFFEEKKAKEIRSMFSSYVSPKIVEVLINNPEKANLGGERKIVTVLFADLIGFTSLSEKKLPEEVVDLLNEYFKEMTDIIFKWDGTLDKFVGDEIMAFWGAPADQQNHAELAVRCALDMIDSLSRMQEKWMKEGKDILGCGIGINTGEVLIGNIGATGKKMDYTIIGDNVNLAARVEKLTRDYGVKIILTEFTKNHLESIITKELIGHYELKSLEAVKVRGKEKEVEIFALKGIPHEKSQPE
jgi:adenylate cyclase